MRAAFGCGKAGVGCRRAANPAKSGNEGNCRSANVIGGVGEDGAKGRHGTPFVDCSGEMPERISFFISIVAQKFYLGG